MNSPIQRVLILDDDACHNTLCMLLLKKTIKTFQPDIIGFTNPTEGLHYIFTEYNTNPVETLVLLDINMPELTGWEVLEELRRLPADTLNYLTIYILSSSINPVDIEKADSHQLVKAYLTKPLSNHINFLFVSEPQAALALV